MKVGLGRMTLKRISSPGDEVSWRMTLKKTYSPGDEGSLREDDTEEDLLTWR